MAPPMPHSPSTIYETFPAVALRRDPDSRYPDTAPFHPSEAYPEWPDAAVGQEPNPVYALVRDVLADLGLDRDRFGTPDWNPFGEFIRPGMRVVIKPNLVLDRHPRGGDVAGLVTHGSVLRPVLDYAAKALAGEGRILIADAPIQTTEFEGALRASRIGEVAAWAAEALEVPVAVADFRQVVAEREPAGHIVGWREQPGDPAGYQEFDLGADSLLAGLADDAGRFRVSNYQARDTLQYHNRRSHRYVMARSVLEADVVLNLPKLKTHCKAGVTLSLKNVVGTVGRKQCLAHHRKGGSARGGDEYPGRSGLKALSEVLERRIDGRPAGAARTGLSLAYRVVERLIRMAGQDPVRDGGWHGNDTVWRMVLDLDRLVLHGRSDGSLADTPQRTVFSLIDGIVAGEGEGPLEADPTPVGAVAAGFAQVPLDRAVTAWMGFDPDRIPLMARAGEAARFRLPDPAEARVVSDGQSVVSVAQWSRSGDSLGFRPAWGWRGHCERGGAGGMRDS